MRRQLHLAIACVGVANALHFPAPLLEARQNVPSVSGDVSPTTAPTTQPTTTTTIADPTTSRPPITTTTSPSAQPPTTTSQPPVVTTTQPPTTSVQPPTSSNTPSQSQQPTTTTRPTTSQAPTTSATSNNVAPTTSSVVPDSTIPPSETIITSTDPAAAPAETAVTTITFTSDGQLVSTTATGTRTQLPTSTSKPGLASGYGSSNNMLSAESKKLIGGIVGTIGGVLLLAGIAFVVYKMWGRKRHERLNHEEEVWGSGGSTSDSMTQQKSGWGKSSLTSKFSEPLDRYRSPSGGAPANSQGYKSPQSVNAASNF